LTPSQGDLANTIAIIKKLERGDIKGIKVKLERRSSNGPSNYPNYSLSISDDGSVIYTGVKNVRTVGTKSYQVPKERVQQLIDELQRVYFFSLKDNYDSRKGDDLVTVSISLDDKSKQVTHTADSKVPRGIAELETRIDEITESNKWV
jgi:Domain of unknown function (DUF6438)